MSSVLNLSCGQKQIYDLLFREISLGNYEIKLPSSFPDKSVNLIVKLVLGEHPEFINFDNCSTTLKNFNDFKLLVLYSVFNPHDLVSAQNKFDAETKRIVQAVIKPNTNRIQKALALHDFIVNNISYDETAIKKPPCSVLSHTAYGAIVQKKAVCEGIAYAFSYLANRIGIKTTVVNGIANGEEHAWNLMKIGANCYHIDITWDIQQHQKVPIKKYDYFCLSDFDLNFRNWDKKILSQMCLQSIQLF